MLATGRYGCSKPTNGCFLIVMFHLLSCRSSHGRFYILQRDGSQGREFPYIIHDRGTVDISTRYMYPCSTDACMAITVPNMRGAKSVEALTGTPLLAKVKRRFAKTAQERILEIHSADLFDSVSEKDAPIVTEWSSCYSRPQSYRRRHKYDCSAGSCSPTQSASAFYSKRTTDLSPRLYALNY